MRSVFCLLIISAFPVFMYGQAQNETSYNNKVGYTSPACQAQKNIQGYKEEMLLHPKEYFLSNSYNSNQCIRDLLSGIGFYAAMIKDTMYFILLEKACNMSDDSVSQMLTEVGKKQFYRNFNDLFKYCYTHQPVCLWQKTLLGLVNEISMSSDRVAQKKQIVLFMQTKVKELKLGESESKFLRETIYLHLPD